MPAELLPAQKSANCAKGDAIHSQIVHGPVRLRDIRDASPDGPNQNTTGRDRSLEVLEGGRGDPGDLKLRL